jgi:alkylation response protein AidB-like acyl-CoA dehydrogenase
MHFRFSDDQFELAGALRDLLRRELAPTELRRVWDEGTGHDPRLWQHLAEMGVLSVLLPEPDGGLGGSMVDAVLLLEELGRAAAPGPVLETIVLGATVLAGTDRAKRLAAGDLTVTAALMDERLVPHRGSDLAVMSIAGDVVLADVDALGLSPVDGLDGGRLLGELPEQAGVSAVERLDTDIGALRDLGAASTAAFLLGLSSRMIDLAAGYARDRRQFGQPIGAFQAVKHLMANALLQVEFARPAVYAAAWSISTDQPTRRRDVSMAKCLASEAAQHAARAALQVHGAIGYTWECDLHLFMKKAWALAPAWGGPSYHRRVVGDAVLGPRSPA